VARGDSMIAVQNKLRRAQFEIHDTCYVHEKGSICPKKRQGCISVRVGGWLIPFVYEKG